MAKFYIGTGVAIPLTTKLTAFISLKTKRQVAARYAPPLASWFWFALMQMTTSIAIVLKSMP
ncbi:MAG: hypothetical protein DCE90_09770 [Pseudanabaena sp.]|nr:MAG: hypothetical protein DCE90_09770 [Pseudanabaena sp.]